MFDKHVSSCVAVVVDPDHERYGQDASITMHDWQEFGILYLSFGDGGSAELHDGICTGDPPPQAVILLHPDRASLDDDEVEPARQKLDGLLERLPGIRDELRRLKHRAISRTRTEEERRAAKAAFHANVWGGTV